MPHIKNIPLCSALILAKKTNSESPTIQEIYPKDFSFEDEKKQFESSMKIPKESTESLISFFNTHSFYCTAFNFPEKDTFYSIIAISKFPFYDFFRFMFDVVKKTFDNGFAYPTPNDKFNCIKTAISTIPYYNFHELINIPNMEPSSPEDIPPSIKITVPIANVSFLYNFTHSSFTFTKFNPCLYFTKDEYLNVWHSLLLNEPTLIVSKDQFRASKAVLASAALLAPCPFADEMCLWLNSTDPRFTDIKKGKSKILLCATHPDNLSNVKNYFKQIIILNPDIKESESDLDIEIYNMMKKTLHIIGDVLNTYSIQNDPYYNLIEGNINIQMLSDAFKKHPTFNLPSLEEVKAFEKTESFKEWRRNLNPGEEYRDIFLNIDPEALFKDRPRCELLNIENNLGILIEKYARDAHVSAVLRHHRKVLHDML